MYQKFKVNILEGYYMVEVKVIYTYVIVQNILLFLIQSWRYTVRILIYFMFVFMKVIGIKYYY